jgi:glycosyltransferase involved in cell wall biosynthesis
MRARRAVAVFHLGATSGPSRSLELPLRWLSEQAELEVVVPQAGAVSEHYGEFARTRVLPYEPLMLQGGPAALWRRAWAVRHDVRRFRGLISRSGADLVIQSAVLLPAVTLAAHLEGVPVVVYAGELFSGSHASRGLRGAAGPLLTRFVGRTAAGVIACSEPVAREYRRGAAHVETILGPVEESYADGDRKRSRGDWQIDAKTPCIVALGSVTEGRGQDTLIQAMSQIRREHPKARCLIFGAPHPRSQDQAFAARLETLVQDLGLSDAVTFCGPVERPADAYAAADVVVNPARFDEPFGRVAFEAAIAGRPVVSTTVGAVPHYLHDEQSALLVPRDDPPSLAAAIVRLIDDRALGERLATAAAGFARSDMSPERAVERFRELLAGLDLPD